jgi:hypothetical protein
MKFKVSVELEGIPAHAWAEDTASKILAPSCWVHAVDQRTANKTDMSAYKLTAWTTDPRAIPKVVWLHIAENEIVHVTNDNPIFGGLPPYLRRKDVLRYRVLIHLRSVTDSAPEDPTPPPSPPESDDGDSGNDGNPDRHHFSGGAVHRIHRFRFNPGVVDGEPVVNSTGNACRWASSLAMVLQPTSGPQAPRMEPARTVAPAVCHEPTEVTSVLHRESLDAAGAQPASDPMVLEAGLHSKPTISLTHKGEGITTPQAKSQLLQDPATVCVAERVSPAPISHSFHVLVSALHRESFDAAGVQPASDLMVLEAGLHSRPNISLTRKGEGLTTPQLKSQLLQDPATVCVAERVSPAPISHSFHVDVPDKGREGSMTPVSSNPAMPAEPVAASGAQDGDLATASTQNDVQAPKADGDNAASEAEPVGQEAPTLEGHTTPPPPEMRGGEVEQPDVTPSSSEAARRLNRYTQEVQLKKRSPLISSPPKPKPPARRPHMPQRSTRIAAQSLAHIPTAKRGEVLLMQKMGIKPPQAPVTMASKKAYKAVFSGKLSDAQCDAFDELFPAVNAGRAARRPTLIRA